MATLPFFTLVCCLPLAAGWSFADPDSTPGSGTARFEASGVVRGSLSRTEEKPPVNLALIGDFGAHTIGQIAVAEMLRSWQPDAVLTVGDNNYLSVEPGDIMDTAEDGTTRNGWQLSVGAHMGEFIARRLDGRYPELRSATPRFFPSVGNHDRGDLPEWMHPLKGYHDYFRENPGGPPRLPEDRGAVHTMAISYYAVRLGPVDCFILDSNPQAEVDEKAAALIADQRQWLASQLAASTARWKIACFHHAPYGSGSYGGHPRMRWPEFAGIDAIFSGHDHLYERLVFSEDGSDTGPLLFVTGHGGAKLYQFREAVPQSRVRKAGVFGALWLRAEEAGLSVEAWSVDPETKQRSLLDTAVRGTAPTGDAADDFVFHGTAGLVVEAALAVEGAIDAAAGMAALEFWSPTGVRAAAGAPPLRHTLNADGPWRVRVAATAPGRLQYALTLTTPERETFEAWKARRLGKSSARQSQATADPDRDGLDNATEFALDLDPLRRNPGTPHLTVAATERDQIDIVLALPRPPAPGVRLHLEERFQPPDGRPVQWLERFDLAPWQPHGGAEAWQSTPPPAATGGTAWLWKRAHDRGPLPIFRWRATLLPPSPPSRP